MLRPRTPTHAASQAPSGRKKIERNDTREGTMARHSLIVHPCLPRVDPSDTIKRQLRSLRTPYAPGEAGCLGPPALPAARDQCCWEAGAGAGDETCEDARAAAGRSCRAAHASLSWRSCRRLRGFTKMSPAPASRRDRHASTSVSLGPEGAEVRRQQRARGSAIRQITQQHHLWC